MTDTFAGIVLLLIFVSAFNNYRKGQLGPWLKSKFFNAAAPAPAGVPTGAFAGLGSAVTVAGAGTALGGVAGTSTAGVGATGGIGLTMAAWALTQVGKRYTWGGNGPDSYDCSGLVDAAARASGRNIGRQTSGTLAAMVHRTTSPHVGTLVFFSQSHVHHVGICIDNGVNMVSALNPSAGVKTQTIASMGESFFFGDL